jgi:hypothetical protein
VISLDVVAAIVDPDVVGVWEVGCYFVLEASG